VNLNRLNDRRVGAVATAVLAAGLTTLFATPASAVLTETDDVLIEGTGYDLGGGGFANGAPTEPATLEWHHHDTAGAASGVLTGTIHFDGVEHLARVKMISTQADGDVFVDYSDEENPPTTGYHARRIEENGSPGLTGAFGAATVKVVLQTFNNGRWGNVGSQTFEYPGVVDTDEVLISRAELDFGAGDLVNGAPSLPATVTWNATPTLLTPVVAGTFFANQSDDLCIRILARYLSVDGTVLDEAVGVQVCVTDDDLRRFAVNIDDHQSGFVRQVRVLVQKQPGDSIDDIDPAAWETVGSQLVSLD
jgi:hypothetical protein